MQAERRDREDVRDGLPAGPPTPLIESDGVSDYLIGST
jgi:hypothetical protein